MDRFVKEMVEELVARYQSKDLRQADALCTPPELGHEETLLKDLRLELDRILEERGEPMPMKIYTLAVARARTLLLGRE